METTNPPIEITTSTPAAAPRRRGSLLIFFLWLILAAGVGYLAWQLYVLQTSVRVTRDKLTQIEQAATRDAQGDQAAVQALQQNMLLLTTQVTQTQNAIQAIKQRLSFNQNDWQIAESLYLIELAARRLQVGRDVKSAILLLETADNELGRLADSSLLPARQALIQDVTALKNVVLPDEDGIILRLQAISDQLPQLPLRTPMAMPTTAKPVGEHHWRQIWASLSAEFKDLIRVRKHGHAIEPLLAPEEVRFLQANLQLEIQQAILALSTGKVKVYQSSLDHVINGLGRYYADAAVVTTAINTLKDLKTVDITPNLPIPNASLKVLKQIIATRAADKVPPA